MPADRNTPAEDHEHASREHHADERVDPQTFSYQLFEHIADAHGDSEADLYVSRVVAELLALSPIVREHISDLILADLVEALHHHGQAAKDAARMVGVVQRDWMNERG